MESNNKINYYIYKDDRLMKSIYTQVFDELPDIGTIEYIGSKSFNNSVNYSIMGDRDKAKNKNFELEDKEKNINKNLKNQIRGEVGYHNTYGENVIRIYANIEDVKTMVNSGLYDNIIKQIRKSKCSKFEDLVNIKGQMVLYDNYDNQEDVFVLVDNTCVWLKKQLLDTDIRVLINILDKVNVVGIIIKKETQNFPAIIKAIAIYA